ncbi:MAG: methyltransferase [Alphaproteobacteria bacterium]|nr:methyltransferase [Alphaproteobacteria bacterium]
MDEFTQDYILNGKIKLLQPKNGYRVAIDPILLAACVHVKPNQKILDAGCGVGAISLILKNKEPSAQITAIDLDEEMCRLCKQNAELNSCDINVINCNVEDVRAFTQREDFDQIVTNPPFFKKEASRISGKKQLANFETIELGKWITFCIKKLKNGGIFSIVHNASRTGDILQSVMPSLGDITIVPIYSKLDTDAKRVIVTGKKGRKSDMKIAHGIVVHEDDGSYTDAMKKILAGEEFQ